MGFQDNTAYIVVNNSQKIVIANRYTFQQTDSITTGLINPRYFASANATKAYVSNWGDPNDDTDDFIAVIDLRTNNVSATIPVDFGPEELLVHNSKLFVAHKGGYGQNNLVSVISGNSVTKTISVGDVPNSMLVAGNSLFVLCEGIPAYVGAETAGSLVEIDLTTEEVVSTYSFETDEHPTALTSDAGKLYYQLDGKVYQTSIAAPVVPSTEIINGLFYTLRAKDGKLYGTDAGDYNSNGSLKIYDLSTYELIQDFGVGIIPGGVYFN